MLASAFVSYAVDITRFMNAPVSIGDRLYYVDRHVMNSRFKSIGILEERMQALLKLFPRAHVDMYCLDLHDGYAYKILVLVTIIEIKSLRILCDAQFMENALIHFIILLPFLLLAVFISLNMQEPALICLAWTCVLDVLLRTFF